MNTMGREFEEHMKKSFLDLLEDAENADDGYEKCTKHNRPVSECNSDDLCELLYVDKISELVDNFDLYAQDVTDWEWLQEFVPGLVIYSAGGVFPLEVNGYLGDLHLYFRAEDGYASLRLSNEKSSRPVESLYSAHMDIPEKYEKIGPQWVSYLLTLIERAKKTEFLYYFQENKIDYDSETGDFGLDVARDDDGNIVFEEQGSAGWGYTPEQAFVQAQDMTLWRYLRVENHIDKDRYPDDWQVRQDRLWSEEKMQRWINLRNLQPIVTHVDGTDRVYPEQEPDFTVRVPELWRNDDGSISVPFKEKEDD